MGIPEELRSVLAEVEDANRELTHAVESADPAAVSLALARLTAAEKRRNHLVHRTTRAPTTAYRTQFPVRDTVIAALKVVNRPASVKLVADIARVQTTRLSTPAGLPLCGGTRCAAGCSPTRSRLARHPVTPTLCRHSVPTAFFPSGVRSSSLIHRTIYVFLPRVLLGLIFLTTTTVLASIAMTNFDLAKSSGLTQLIAELARSLRGASADTTHDPRWVIEAARTELSLIEDRDLEGRHAAADRARKQLSDGDFLFGAGTTDRVSGVRSIA